MNILQFISAHKWMMYQPALHMMINVVSKITEDPVAIAQAFHGSQFERYLTEDNQPKKHTLLNNMDFPIMENSYAVWQTGNVAIIPVIGAIFPRSSSVPMSYGANVKVDTFNHDFNVALDNPEIDTIIKVYDSPGGEVTGVSETSQMIFKARSQKKIISYVYGMAASGGFWWASAGEEIVAANTAEVGSIGVVASYTDFSDFDAKQGIKKYEIVSDLSPNKRPDLSTDEGKLSIQAVVNDLAFVFVESVASQRGVQFKEVVEQYGGGSMFVAKEALKRGMIDRISTLEQLIDSVKINKNSNLIGGRLMTLEEMKAKDPDGYKAVMDEAKKANVKENDEAVAKEKAKAEKLAADAKKEEDAKALQIIAQEKLKVEELAKSQQDLSKALKGVGGNGNASTDAEQDAIKSEFVKIARKTMNDSRKY